MQKNEISLEMLSLLSTDKMRFFPPASREQIKKIEDLLKVSLPKELIDLLCISNGAIQLMRNSKTKELMGIGYIYWPVDEIITNTLRQHQYNKTINSIHTNKYLFFADNGCGEYFGYKIMDGRCNEVTIYIYYPINDECVSVAFNLREWVTNWLSGKLS